MIVFYWDIYCSSTSNGVFSGSHLLCSNAEEDGWFKSRFDESSWPNAYVISEHSAYSDGTLNSFDDQARLVWHHELDSDTIYCRVRLFYGNIVVLPKTFLTSVTTIYRTSGFFLQRLRFALLLELIWWYLTGASCMKVPSLTVLRNLLLNMTVLHIVRYELDYRILSC